MSEIWIEARKAKMCLFTQNYIQASRKSKRPRNSKKKMLIQFWFHESGKVEPRCIICTLVGEACILRFDMLYFIWLLKNPAFWGEQARLFEAQTGNAQNDNSQNTFRWRSVKHNLRFKLLYISFKHHMGSANQQPAWLVAVVSLWTVTYRYLVSPA